MGFSSAPELNNPAPSAAPKRAAFDRYLKGHDYFG
jgi:hypothetical protein